MNDGKLAGNAPSEQAPVAPQTTPMHNDTTAQPAPRKTRIGLIVGIAAAFLVIVMVLAFALSFNGRNQDGRQGGSSAVVLNERQKRILRDNGLPEDYASLADFQRNAIVRIEDTLAYLEETYHDEFEYKDYASGGLDGEFVSVSVKDESPEKIVTVSIYYKDGKYTYFDNYRAEMAEEPYAKEVAAYLSKYFASSDFHVYADDAIDEVEDGSESIVTRAVGHPLVVVKNNYSEERIRAVIQSYAEWLTKEKHGRGGISFRVYEADMFEEIGESDYQDYLGEELYWLIANIDQDAPFSIEKYD